MIKRSDHPTPDSSSGADPSPSPAGQSDVPVRILLVEDSPIDHLYTRSLLNRMSLEVDLHWVESHSGAVEEITAGGYDLCLVDYTLEERTGVDLVREMRGADIAIPMIILTSRTDREAELLALEVGADDYLVKGEFDVRLLERSIRYALEQARMVQQLRQSQQRYRMIVETAQEGIWMIDADGVTSFVNRRMAEMLGYTVAEMVGHRVDDFFDVDGHGLAQRMLKQQRRGRVSEFDFRFRRKDGASFWAIVAGNPFFDDNGRYIGSLGMVTDITDRKRAEEALTRSKEQLEMRVVERTAEISTMVERLEAANRDQKRFVADASHDFRTPLTIVTAEVDLLLNDPAITPAVRASLEVIAAQARRLETLANDLLVLASLDSQDGLRSPSRTRIDELAFESIAELSVLARESGITWKVDADTPIELVCDPHLLRRALTNLMENAIKYSSGPTTVAIRLGHADGVVEIEIADAGIGIAEEDLPNIFNRFYRADSARNTPGTGLGLSIVQGAVDAHGGSIAVSSALGKGTTIRLRLPDRDASEPDAAA